MARFLTNVMLASGGYPWTETVPNSAAYLKTWIARLKADHRLLLTAASAAQKAADYISRNSFAESTDTQSDEILELEAA
jgi:antirestriction protein ArdC